MALNKTNAAYITIESVNNDIVSIRLHKDGEHRQRYKDQAESEFETTRVEQRKVSVDLSINADNTKSIQDNSVTAGYIALKTLEEFNAFEDV